MADVERIGADELSAEGYISEANRRFFHPLGLALERTPGLTYEQVAEWLRAHPWPEASHAAEPEAIEAAWQFVQHLGLDRGYISGVWDCRDCPEGVNYQGEPMLEMVRRNAAHVEQLWMARVEARTAALGYMIQPAE